MSDVILGAVISVISATIGAIIQMFITERLDNNKGKIQYLSKILEKRVNAYEKIYDILSQCKRIYENMTRYDYDEVDREWFYPTINLIEECFIVFQKYELYLDEDIKDFLDLNLRVTRIHNERVNQETDLSYLIELSEENFQWIQVVLGKIRENIGINFVNSIK